MINRWESAQICKKVSSKAQLLFPINPQSSSFLLVLVYISFGSREYVDERKSTVDISLLLSQVRYWVVIKLLLIASLLSGVIAQPQPLPPAAKDAQALIHYFTGSRDCTRTGKHKHHGPFPTKTIVQDKCINLPNFLSYKTWQPTVVEEYVYCDLYVFPETDCGGEGMTGFGVPTTEDKADCLDAFVAYGDGRLEGSKSVRFGCEYFPPPGYHAANKEPSKGYHK